MSDELWQRFRAAQTNPDAEGDPDGVSLAGLAAELQSAPDDEERRLLVNVLGSLALLADEPGRAAAHLAAAEQTAASISSSPSRDLAYFVLTEVALRTGHPDVTVRCAAQVTAAGLATHGLQDLHEQSLDYLARARADLRHPGLSTTLDHVEALRVDPELSVEFPPDLPEPGAPT